MTREEIVALFAPVIRGDWVVISKNVLVDLDTFVAIFSEAADGSYEALMAVGESRGYGTWLTRLRDDGVLQ